MPIDPHPFATAPGSRQADAIQELRRRVGVLERGGATPSTTTFSGSVEDATTIRKGKLQLAGDIAGSASSVLVRKLTSLQTSAITDQVLNDKAHGLYIGQADGEGLRWTIAHGNVASGPVNVPSPSYSFSRYMTHTGSEDGTTSHRYSTLSVYNQATSASKAQPTAAYFQALTESTQTRSGTLVNPDATAFISYAKVQSSGKGWAVGGASYCDNTSSAGEGVTGFEIGPSNSSTNITQTVVGGGAAEKSMGIWLHAGTGTRNIAAGIQFGSLSATRKFDTGIYFTAAGAQGNPVVTSSYRDDGNAVTSLDIRGTHTNAINIASGAGMVKDLNGDLQEAGSGSYADGPGLRWNIQHGTAASPVTTTGSTFKVSRYEEFATDQFEGAHTPFYAAFQAINVATANTRAQPVAISAYAKTSCTTPASGSIRNDDALAISAVGIVEVGGTGSAIGGYFEGRLRSTVADARAVAAEFQTYNATGIDGTFNSGGGSNIRGLWIVLNGRAGGSAIDLGNPANFKWNVGISFKNTNGGPCSDVSIQDDGNASTSYLVNGTHSTAAIAIGPSAGKFLCGATSTGHATRALIRPSNNDEKGLMVQGFSSSHSANLFEIADGTTGAALSVFGPDGKLGVGVVFATHPITLPDHTTSAGGLAIGTDCTLYRAAANYLTTDDTFAAANFDVRFSDGTSYINLREQSATPTSPNATALRLFARDTAGVTELCYVVNGGAVTVVGAAGAGFLTAVSDTNTIDHTVTGTTLSSVIPTTATPQITALGIGVVSPATGLSVGGAVVISPALSFAASGNVLNLTGSKSITAASVTYRAVMEDSTFSFNATTSSLNLFVANYTVTSDVSPRAFTNFVTLQMAPTFSPLDSAGAHTITNIRAVGMNPILTALTTATATITTGVGLFMGATAINAGWTVTNWLGMKMSNPTGAGTLTNLIAVDVDDLTKGATMNLSMRSVGALVQLRHAGPGVFGANAAATNASVGLEVQSTTKALLLSRMTTTQRDAMTALDGMVIFNTTTTQCEKREAGAWLAF